ncbi:MAG: hypothetical protein IJO94_07525 [Firmicutes bacterium]|nr:hypothetical protein [Bacillota bacterium]
MFGGNEVYKPEDFQTYSHTSENGSKVLCLVFPTPEYVPLCFRIYIVSNADYSKIAYYTIERGETDSFLCAWKEEQHINIHSVTAPETAILPLETTLILSLFNDDTATVTK